MERWMLFGSLSGAVLAVGVRQLAVSEAQSDTPLVVEQTVQALTTRPVDADLRARTAGVQCVVTSAVRELPRSLELRTAGQVRDLPVRNVRTHTGQAVGELILPFAMLDDVRWRLTDLSLVAADGAQALLRFDRATASCVAALPPAPDVTPTEVRCPTRGGVDAPSVRGLHVWDEDLLPTAWAPVTAAADNDGFLLFDVPTTGTAELALGDGLLVQVHWEDGICEPVSIATDAELCVHIPRGDLLYDDPSYGIFIEEHPVPVDPEGVACGRTPMGKAVVTQVWLTQNGSVERSVVAPVDDPGRQEIDVAPHAYSTLSGALLYPGPDGPQVVSVRGLAEAAGLEDGDVILAVDGRSVANVPLTEAVAPLHGTEAAVALTLERNDEVFDLSIIFDEKTAELDTGM